jgi:hypothetical protein
MAANVAAGSSVWMQRRQRSLLVRVVQRQAKQYIGCLPPMFIPEVVLPTRLCRGECDH